MKLRIRTTRVKIIQRSFRLRLLSGIMSVVMLNAALLPGVIIARPYAKFDEKSKKNMDQYVDRGSRLGDESSWNNYVNLGAATEEARWEMDEFEELSKQLDAIDKSDGTKSQKQTDVDAAELAFENARLEWEADAEEYIFTERGEFKAQKAALDTVGITDQEYEAMIAQADATVSGNTELTLDVWEAAVASVHSGLEAAFETQLGAKVAAAKAANIALTGTELAAFDAALTKREETIRQEFLIRDQFFLLKARNRYVAVMRTDDVSGKYIADQGSANAIGQVVLNKTLEELEANTESALTQAKEDLENLESGPSASGSDLTGIWASKMETVIQTGLVRWQQAEEELYRERLLWTEQTKRTRAEAEGIWKANHEKLKAARELWLKDVNEKIKEGRKEWDDKYVEFQNSRTLAEQELAQFITEEQGRRDAGLASLGDMVRGGGAALLEAKDSYRYYQSLVENMAFAPGQCPTGSTNQDLQLYCFYVKQRDMMGTSISQFQQILASAEANLDANMNSNSGSTGLLKDKRIFAGAIAGEIQALSASGFRSSLEALGTLKQEEFLLYRSDLVSMTDRNELFAKRAEELSGQAFDYNGATSIDALREMVLGFDSKFSDQKVELIRIINQDRGSIDPATKLAAIKTDISSWFSISQDEDARLKREVTKYFNDGLSGYYLSGEDNDPYLLTRAEYEWELLRRERNTLSDRFKRAESVKRYADLAAKNQAGLEIASLTNERAALSKVRSDLREVSYLILKGDIAIDPAALANATVRDSEFARVLGERGIDISSIFGRQPLLSEELAILDDLAALNNPTQGDLAGIRARMDAYLAKIPETERASHRLAALRSKLQIQENSMAAGDPATVANRWTVLKNTASVLAAEIGGLTSDYDFNGLQTEVDQIKLQFAQRSVVSLGGDLTVIRAQIQANAVLLAAARQELEIAKKEYRDARIDFDILRSGNAEELIRIDILNTTTQLSQTLNGMSKVQGIPGFDNVFADIVKQQQLAYANEVAQNEVARRDQDFTEKAIAAVTGMGAARDRGVKLEAILTANNIPALTSMARADLFISKRSELLNEGGGNDPARSSSIAIQLFDSLAQIKAAYSRRASDSRRWRCR
ncbi:MAG: hypothetical protein K8S54_14570 [Spirochaetia bacterium]|nr:hypothetical protein [Spirochaetia bacterium]